MDHFIGMVHPIILGRNFPGRNESKDIGNE